LAAILWAGPTVTASDQDQPAAAPAPAAELAAAPLPAAGEGAKKRRQKKRKRRERSPEAPKSAPLVLPLPRRPPFAAASLTAFAFTLTELVWYRMLAPVPGRSTYTFGLILAVALAGIGLGSLARFGRARGDRGPQGPSRKARATFLAFATTCALEAA